MRMPVGLPTFGLFVQLLSILWPPYVVGGQLGPFGGLFNDHPFSKNSCHFLGAVGSLLAHGLDQWIVEVNFLCQTLNFFWRENSNILKSAK